MVLGIGSRAIRAYIDTYKRMPSDEILASVHQAVENTLKLSEAGKGMGGIFESIGKDMSTTDGIIMRNRMLSICLPVTLFAITSQMVTLIPGQFNKSEIFRVHRVAGSTFGDLKKGDKIDQFYNGRYAVMDQMSAAIPADGAKKDFAFDTATDAGQAMLSAAPPPPGLKSILAMMSILKLTPRLFLSLTTQWKAGLSIPMKPQSPAM